MNSNICKSYVVVHSQFFSFRKAYHSSYYFYLVFGVSFVNIYFASFGKASHKIVIDSNCMSCELLFQFSERKGFLRKNNMPLVRRRLEWPDWRSVLRARFDIFEVFVHERRGEKRQEVHLQFFRKGNDLQLGDLVCRNVLLHAHHRKQQSFAVA